MFSSGGHWRDSAYISTGRSVVDRRPSSVLSMVRAEIGFGASMAAMKSATNIEDTIFSLYKEEQSGMVNVGRFFKSIAKTGIQKGDPRLKKTVASLRKLSLELTGAEEPIEGLHLNQEQFVSCIAKNIVMINRILRNRLIIPDWAEFKDQIKDIFTKCEGNEGGLNAQYIDHLARVDPKKWAVSVCTVDGQRFSLGSYQDTVCIQSCSKVLNYAKALHELGADTVHKYVGQEPSGRQFNELTLDYNNKPHNPLINAGAIVVCSLLEPTASTADRYDRCLKYYKRFAGDCYVGFNNAIFLSERSTADRNVALVHYMRENKCFPAGTDVKAMLEFYFQVLCSVEVTPESGAVMAASLANGGICPITDDPVLNTACIRDVLSLMHSCGTYNYSGQFAFKIGLPAKSSASGLILLVVPNIMGICVWSPHLDQYGNSVRGVQFCQELVKRFKFHNYDNLKHNEQRLNPRLPQVQSKAEQVVNVLFAAAKGDVSAMRRYMLQGVDLSLENYDSRTALHLACAEGHTDCVSFLLGKAHVNPMSRDRWNCTPQDEAETHGHTKIVQMIEDYINEPMSCESDAVSEIKYADSEDSELDSGWAATNQPMAMISDHPLSPPPMMFGDVRNRPAAVTGSAEL